MDKGKKRIRACLLCVVLAAVVVGCVYYYHEMQQDTINKGTLISKVEMGMEKLWQ